MLKLPGVVPPEGVTEIHVPPCAAAVKPKGAPELNTRTVRGDGSECPGSYSKDTAREGQTLSLPEPVPVTTNWTGTLCGELAAPLEVMVIFAL